jgi:hypothetical protein
MDKQQAKDIVKDTLERPFDKNRFTLFVKNLLNQIDEAEKARFVNQGNYIPDAYKQYISSLERIGKYSAGDHKIDILIVKLKKETSIERARTMQRNFIARYLNGSRGGELKDAALVAFVSPDSEDWRFSLVKMDYRFEEGKKGKVKVKEEFTPARRWSFLVGTNENSHTAQSRLAPLIIDDTHDPALADLEEAFNIETVTKEFFTEYRNLFLRVKEALDAIVAKDAKIKNNFAQNGVNTVDFAKKLLGQIVFLYFLQKKGWFGVARDAAWGTGSKQFLRELFEQKHGGYKNFFNDILEPLFYEALRLDRSHEDHYYSQFNCKIPFLNGGLFDPINGYDWAKTDIFISNELFSNKHKTKEGDEGNGILDVFDRYNFTVKEDEPLEKEVAIDPELLGKAYEKFNAIRPDNFDEFQKALKSGKKGEESKFNKQFGVYYTPREIVHYMCQQSLINYLSVKFNGGAVIYEKPGDDQTDLLGNKGKRGQLDLTIAHTEKPVIPQEDIETLIHLGERMSENEEMALIKQQRIHDGRQETSGYKLKLPESIHKNANQIDEKLSSIRICDPAIGSGAFPVGMMNEIVRARNVLSNFIKSAERTAYHFKRQCIENSLYGVDIDSGAVEIAKLRLWLSLVVDEEDIRQIKPLPNLDYKIVCGNSLIGFPDQWDSPVTKEIESLKHEFFSETNPTKKSELKSQIDSKINERYKNSVKTFGHEVKFDFRTAFSEVFHDRGGFDVVIANPPWGSDLSKEEKTILKTKFQDIDSSTPNSYAYFLGLAKNISAKNNITYVLPDSLLIKDYAKTRKYLSSNISVIKWFQNVGIPDNLRPFENVEHDVCLIVLSPKINDEILCSTSFYNSAIKGIETKEWLARKNEVILDEFDFTYNLLLTKNDLGILSKIQKFKPIDSYLQCHEGIHTGNSRDILFKRSKENKYCKPLYYGSSAGDKINNYSSYRAGWYVDYRPEIIGKEIGQYASLRDERIFKHAKIYITRTGNPFKAFIDDNNFASNNFFSLQYKDYSKNTIESLKIILPFIVSKLSQYFIRTFAAPRLGDIFIETKILHLLKFRIPETSEYDTKKIVKIVDNILTLTQTDDYPQNETKKAKVKEYETEIDQMVYKLYDLTPYEIAVVEGKDVK